MVYRTKFEDDFDDFLDEHGGIDQIIADQLARYQDDLEGLIKHWVKVRMMLYDSYIGTSKYYKENDMFRIIKDKVSIVDDITSHYAMKLISAANPPILDWVLNNETMLFLKMIELGENIKQSLHKDILTTEKGIVSNEDLYNYIFRSIFGEDYDEESFHLIYEKDFKGKTKKVLGGSVKIYWNRIGSIITKWKKYDLHKGMVKVPYSKFGDVISYGVKEIFRESFEEYRESVQEEFLNPYREIVREMFSDIIDSQHFTSTCNNIDEIINDSPLCIQEIDKSIRSGVNISYQYALQLSLYVKKFFDVDGLANYWWDRDIRNRVYPTLEDFKSSRRDLMYHFQHQYGYGGTATDYRPMKCSTCRSAGRYCFFKTTPDVVERRLMNIYQNHYAEDLVRFKKMVKKIGIFVRNKKYGVACAFEMMMRLQCDVKTLKKWKSFSINHPLLQYYKTCRGIRKDEEPPKDRPNVKSKKKR